MATNFGPALKQEQNFALLLRNTICIIAINALETLAKDILGKSWSQSEQKNSDLWKEGPLYVSTRNTCKMLEATHSFISHIHSYVCFVHIVSLEIERCGLTIQRLQKL